MFCAVEALLAEQNLSFSKHGAVHAVLGEHFAKTGDMDAKFHRWVLDAFDKCLHGDCAFELTLTSYEVREMIERARELLQTVEARPEATT